MVDVRRRVDVLAALRRMLGSRELYGLEQNRSAHAVIGHRHPSGRVETGWPGVYRIGRPSGRRRSLARQVLEHPPAVGGSLVHLAPIAFEAERMVAVRADHAVILEPGLAVAAALAQVLRSAGAA